MIKTLSARSQGEYPVRYFVVRKSLIHRPHPAAAMTVVATEPRSHAVAHHPPPGVRAAEEVPRRHAGLHAGDEHALVLYPHGARNKRRYARRG